MSERRPSGVLDTCVYIDLAKLDRATLPRSSELTAITLAELHQGITAAKDSVSQAVRAERLGVAIANFEPLPFDGRAAARYGSLVGLTRAANRDPRPRKTDLMIAAIASVHGLPLYTRNPKDFVGLESVVEIITV
ncbi:type II toxin-antitoxin system VapC family toxin [Saccharothrix sp. Mg75]|uniref:type II toxin-antitoxin system VapC family toxin n=1 Tax=Saccharothrix sp. Mg75 TaxID=3445357 RepID=UPI003EEBB266